MVKCRKLSTDQLKVLCRKQGIYIRKDKTKEELIELCCDQLEEIDPETLQPIVKPYILGRTPYMQYRNAQIVLKEQFNIEDPATLEALVVSIGYEGDKDLNLSPITDAALKKWIRDLYFEAYYPGRFDDPEEGRKIIEQYNWSEAAVSKELSKWGKLARSAKIALFEMARHVEHVNGLFLEHLFKWNPLVVKIFMDNLSHLLDES